MTPHGLQRQRQRIGLYGGAFDPPHRAHRALAELALQALQLDALHIIPTGLAWHKNRRVSDAHHRLALCELAFADMPGMCVDRRELDRPGPSYTVDTVRSLRAEHPGAEFFVVIGQDQAERLHTWHAIEELAAQVTFAVAARPEAQILAHQDVQPLPKTVLPMAVGAGAVPIQTVLLTLPAMPYSSSDIRAQIAKGQPPAQISALMPSVAGYIQSHGLYI